MKMRSGLITALAAAGLLPLAALAADTPAAPSAPAAKAKPVEIRCESTGSRIRHNKAEDCAKSTQPTTNYYEKDLQSTGQIDLSKALRELDPRIR